MEILGFDIGQAFTPDVSLLETVVRGVVMYAAIYLLLRALLRGRTGGTTMSDLLVLVLIADAGQNAMAGDYQSITNGIVLVATVVGSSFALDWLGYHVPAFERFVHPERRPLVIDGRLIRRTLAAELMTDEELMTQLRLQGVDDVADVKAAYLEGNGEVSVVKRGADDAGRRSSTARRG